MAIQERQIPGNGRFPRLDAKLRLPQPKIIDFQSRIRQMQDARGDYISALRPAMPDGKQMRREAIIELSHSHNPNTPAALLKDSAPEGPRNRAERRHQDIEFNGRKITPKRWKKKWRNSQPQDVYGEVARFATSKPVKAAAEAAAAVGIVVSGGAAFGHLHDNLTPSVIAQGLDGDGTGIVPPNGSDIPLDNVDIAGISAKGPLLDVDPDAPVIDVSVASVDTDNLTGNDSGQTNIDLTPLAKSSMEFRFGTDISESDRALIQKWTLLTKQYWGNDAPFVTVYDFSDLDVLNDTYLQECVCLPYPSRATQDTLLRRPFPLARPDALLLFSSSEWTSLSGLNKIQRIAHEMTHVFQYELTGEFSVIIGPTWLREGSANYSMLRVAAINGLISWDREKENNINRAKLISRGLNAFEVSDETEAYTLGFLATDFLALRFGDQSILDFFRAAGEARRAGQGWKVAFESTYGMTVDDFYTQFDTYLTQLKGK